MTFEIFRRWSFTGYRWFWRLRAKNHRIIAVGGEGFHNKGDVQKIIDRMVNELSAAEIKVLGDA
jgi:uncharacterized protein YegP (UPF0339 family)